MYKEQKMDTGVKKSQSLFPDLGDCKERKPEVTFNDVLRGLRSVGGCFLSFLIHLFFHCVGGNHDLRIL